jgi:hypothetical protein
MGVIKRILAKIRKVDLSKSAHDEWLALNLAYLTAQQKGFVPDGQREKLLDKIDAFRRAVGSAPSQEVEEEVDES